MRKAMTFAATSMLALGGVAIAAPAQAHESGRQAYTANYDKSDRYESNHYKHKKGKGHFKDRGNHYGWWHGSWWQNDEFQDWLNDWHTKWHQDNDGSAGTPGDGGTTTPGDGTVETPGSEAPAESS